MITHMGSVETIAAPEPDQRAEHGHPPRRARVSLALVLLVLVVATGCASVGATPRVASTDDLVWDCGWRRMP